MEKAVLQDQDIMTICHQIAQNLEFGLKLIRERMGDIEFEITIEALREPEVYIRDLIQKTYKDE